MVSRLIWHTSSIGTVFGLSLSVCPDMSRLCDTGADLPSLGSAVVPSATRLVAGCHWLRNPDQSKHTVGRLLGSGDTRCVLAHLVCSLGTSLALEQPSRWSSVCQAATLPYRLPPRPLLGRPAVQVPCHKRKLLWTNNIAEWLCLRYYCRMQRIVHNARSCTKNTDAPRTPPTQPHTPHTAPHHTPT